MAGDDDATGRERDEEREENDCADEPGLLRKDREDGIAVGLRQIVELLDALAESSAEESAAPDGDERLLYLIAARERVRGGVDEGLHPFEHIRSDEEKCPERDERDERENAEVASRRSGGEVHHRAGREEEERGRGVRLGEEEDAR